jgi:hypothetical protein
VRDLRHEAHEKGEVHVIDAFVVKQGDVAFGGIATLGLDAGLAVGRFIVEEHKAVNVVNPRNGIDVAKVAADFCEW